MNPLKESRPATGCMHGSWDNDGVCQLKTAYQRINIVRQIEKRFRKRTNLRMLEFGPGLGCLIDLVHSNWPQAEYHVADTESGLLEWIFLHGIHVSYFIRGDSWLSSGGQKYDSHSRNSLPIEVLPCQNRFTDLWTTI